MSQLIALELSKLYGEREQSIGHTANCDGRAKGNLLRLIVEVVDVPVEAHHAHRLQREVLLRPHLHREPAQHRASSAPFRHASAALQA